MQLHRRCREPNYHLGAPWGGVWQEILNSDATCYGGSGMGNAGSVHAGADTVARRVLAILLATMTLAAARAVVMFEARRLNSFAGTPNLWVTLG